MTDSIEITGGEYPPIQRVSTGFWSLDQALGNPTKNSIGAPITAYELYGPAGSGKSTICFALAGIIAKSLQKSIVVAPIEELDRDFVKDVLTTAEYSGRLHFCGGENDEKMMDEMLELLEGKESEDFSCAILDSVGAISPIAEVDGNLSDAVMGRRAMLVSKFTRRITRMRRFRKTPLALFATNHVHQNIGSMGSSTSGGEALKYLARVRMRIRKADTFDDGSYLITGKVEKLSYGPTGRPFTLFCLAGKGLHRGMTAVWDCVNAGLASAERTVKLGEDSYGYMKALIQQAQDGEDVFKPFIDALGEHAPKKNGKKTKKETSENELHHKGF